MSDAAFPTPYLVGVRAYEGGDGDDWGNETDSWADPVPQPVYGWGAPGRQDAAEPKVVGHDRVVVETELLVPSGFTCSPQDRVILDFDPDTWTEDAGIPEHDVLGEVESYDRGPFGWNPGGVVNLRRVTG
ncbi:hypothetical protein [Williamsia serinedens]|uniref:Head-to-tail stopper n=1 Tax=Williamsia serinedens TaxID=391736 RepID=A0ABT1H7S0_9NOCA|nr:hypothetical protein [Williamsia serinedens]MCP2162663.1 hypothetical protein [Williamsia serinedens]